MKQFRKLILLLAILGSISNAVHAFLIFKNKSSYKITLTITDGRSEKHENTIEPQGDAWLTISCQKGGIFTKSICIKNITAIIEENKYPKEAIIDKSVVNALNKVLLATVSDDDTEIKCIYEKAIKAIH